MIRQIREICQIISEWKILIGYDKLRTDKFNHHNTQREYFRQGFSNIWVDTNRNSRIPIFVFIAGHMIFGIFLQTSMYVYAHIYVKIFKRFDNSTSRENHTSLLILRNFKIKHQRASSNMYGSGCIFCNAILQHHIMHIISPDYIYFMIFSLSINNVKKI